MRSGFHVLVPVASLSNPLPRMDLELSARFDLALAFARDTSAALSESGAVDDVIAVAADDHTAPLLAERGLRTSTADPDATLAETVSAAVWEATNRSRHEIAVVVSDLPALEADEVDRALSEVVHLHPFAYVPDLRDGGTTMVAARRIAGAFDITKGSGMRHLLEGHPAIGRQLLGLRCDVDDLEALRMASAMRVGPFTGAVLKNLDISVGRSA